MLSENKKILQQFFLNKTPYFYHPGMLGDVIYSIPFCLACIGIYSKEELNNGKKFNLIMDALIKRSHSTEQTYNSILSLKTLLKTQPYFNEILCYKHVDFGKLFNGFDLGGIRKGYVSMDNGDIQLRYNHLYRTLRHYQLNDPWIILKKNQSYNFFKNKIIVFRSPRYRNKNVRMQPLKNYKDSVVFIGSKNDYSDFTNNALFCPHFHMTTSFLQVANIMNNCAFCVGNQTSYFAVAEALKIPRLCELSSSIPDVIPKGDYANDFVNDQDLSICLDLYAKQFIQ